MATKEECAALSLDKKLVRAMAHPVRVDILAALAVEPAAPVELVGKVGQPLGNVAYHVRELEKLGCIEECKTEQVRGATKTTYRNVVNMLLDGDVWADLDPMTKRMLTDRGMAAIIDRSDTAIRAGTFDARPERHLSDLTLSLDHQAFVEGSEMLREALERFYALADESSARAGETDEGFPVSMSMLFYESPAA